MKRLILIIYILFLTIFKYAQQESKEILNMDDLDQYLVHKTKTNEFSGVVLIAKEGKPLFEETYGYASKRFNVENKINTKFNIGSLGKHITSMAVLRLAEKGLLNLNDPIGKYLLRKH